MGFTGEDVLHPSLYPLNRSNKTSIIDTRCCTCRSSAAGATATCARVSYRSTVNIVGEGDGRAKKRKERKKTIKYRIKYHIFFS